MRKVAPKCKKERENVGGCGEVLEGAGRCGRVMEGTGGSSGII